MNEGSNPEQAVQRLRDRLREATATTILEAAEEAFADSGLHAARMDDIAARAGVSVGTLYNYFADRNALALALIESRKAHLLDLLDQALVDHEGKPFEEQLGIFFRTLFDHFEAHRRFFTILMEGELARDGRALPATAKPRETMQGLYRRFATLVDRGLQSGRLRPEGAEVYSALLMGMLRGVLVRTLYETDPPGSLVGRAPQLVAFFMRGAGTT